MKKKILSAILASVMTFGAMSGVLSVMAAESYDITDHVVSESDAPMRLYYDEEASHGVAEGYDDVDTYFGSGASLIEAHPNDDWERWSIPIGNGYFGANLFGRTETERIQLTEKTLANPYRIVNDSSLPTDGLNNFSETYIDFGHTNSAVTNYSRELDLKTAISTVEYDYNGVTYSREYFTSYPDKAMVIKLDASKDGVLDFVLRPTVPYEQEYMTNPGDNGGKTGTVTSSVSGNVGNIVLSGTLQYFGIDFVGLYNVYSDGTVTATTCINADGDTDGTITVSGATSAYIVITMGTDYELVSEQFTESLTNKPTQATTLDDAMAKVKGYMDAASVYSYDQLKARHLADYQDLFGRVTLDLDYNEADFALTTDELLNNYKNGSGSTYLEALYFQYGRYLLIASSRSGALPANLQGVWNRYNHSPWSSGYWHNINVQMNYWPAFSTNIAETFEAYVEYNNAYMAKAMEGATSAVRTYNSAVLGLDGGNGWSISTGGYVSDVYGSESIGNLGFTTQLFWEYFAYTQDEEILREVVYPVLVEAARFITKMVKEDEDGNYIAVYSDSPEQYVNGVWYYTDQGTAYAQSFAYQNNYNLLLAAKELGISTSDVSHEDYAILQTVLKQIDKYDPIRVGLSGQVKEFFEEDYYGDLGEYTHRHISQLVGLYPGNVINGTTPAWLDAAKYTLTERGDKATGWGVAHRLNLWARVQDGERAYDLLEQLLKVNTATNLWDLHPPFQIDGNLGGTSGISEMLLQSHAGYVEPLAAIPSAWANGSYTGLVARGNFEVSAEWADGLATAFNIKSLKGGDLSVKYSGIENAIVTDSKGRAVSYTVTGDDLITFATESGETYYIWGFTAKHVPEAVDGLTLATEILGSTTLTWSKSDDALCYNVYVAKGDAPDYTLLTATTDTSFVYSPLGFENDRMTFAVTAVGIDGSESARSLAYRNPDDISSPVLDVSANVVNDELQVVIKSTEYSEKYRLYSKDTLNSAWTLVAESKYPIIIDNTYVKTNIYGVSAINRYGEESEIVKIGTYNTSSGTIDYNAANILEGLTFVASEDGKLYQHSSTTYGDYGKLTDGDFSTSTGRFSTKQTANDVLEGTVMLPATFMLGELKIYDFNAWFSSANNMGQHIKIDVYADGKWTTVKEITSTEEILKLRKSDTNGTHIVIDLSLVKAQMVKIRLDTPVSGNSISINEIQLSGVAVGEGVEFVAKDNVFDGYAFAATNPSDGSEWKKYEYITDGKTGWADPGRFATSSGKPADGTLDFGGKVYNLENLTVEYTTADLSGLDFALYTYRNGAWTEVVNKTYDVGVSKITFNLGGVEAEKVRFRVSGQRSTANYIGISEMTCTGYEVVGAKVIPAVTKDNILSDNTFVANITEQMWLNDISKLTDGDYGNSSSNSVLTGTSIWSGAEVRYATTNSSTSGIDVQMKFGTKAYLDTLRIKDHNGWSSSANYAGDQMTIQILQDGEWINVHQLNSNAEILSHRTVYNASNFLFFDMEGICAEGIRIIIPARYSTYYIALEEIECLGTILENSESDSTEDVESNVLANRTADQLVLGNGSIHPGAGPLTDAFDGKLNTRFAISGAPTYFTVEIALDHACPLYTMSFYPFFNQGEASRSDNTKIEVYVDGVWITMVSGLEIVPSKTPTTASLGGVVAEKVRITFANKTGGTTATIYEITCTTGAVDAVDRKPLLEAYMALDAIATNDPDKASLKEEKLNAIKPLLMDTDADADTVATYINSVNEAIAELNHVCSGGTATCQKKAVCADCGKEYGSLAPHTPEADDGDCTTAIKCSVCSGIATEANANHTGGTATCTAKAKCTVCNKEYGDFAAHTPETDDGDCTTAIKCSVCEAVTTEANANHTGGTPTCEAKAKCTVCNKEYGDFAEHTTVVISGKAPTCTESGLTDGEKCTVCGDVIVAQTVIPADGHTNGNPIVENNVEPDCTNSGGYDTVVYCTVCNKEVSRVNTVVSAHGHSYGDWNITVQPTETENGEKRRDCNNCDAYETAIVATLSHEHSRWDTVTLNAVAPTCTSTGLTEGAKCSGCGEILVEQNVVPALGHTESAPVTENNVSPTCTTNGSYDTVVYCTVCDTEISRVNATVSANGHTHGDPVVENNVSPTCTTQGSYDTVIYCTECNTEISRTNTNVSALGHTEVTVSGTAPTCTESGLTDGKKCSVCEEILVEQETVAAIGHTEIIVNGKEATCMDNGLTDGLNCFTCGEVIVEQEEIPASGHIYSSVVTPPTCESDGYVTYTCAVCDDTYISDKVDALGHVWTEATTESPKTCENCGVTEGEKLPESTTDTDVDLDSSDDNHDDAGAIERFWCMIINFFRKLFGLPEECICDGKH